jgi:hypothetical protein
MAMQTWTNVRLYEHTDIQMMYFWIVKLCRLVGRHQCLGVMYSLLLHPWWWKQYVSPKCWYLPVSVHGIITQKNDTDILTAMKTSISHTIFSTYNSHIIMINGPSKVIFALWSNTHNTDRSAYCVSFKKEQHSNNENYSSTSNFLTIVQ